MNQTLLLVFSMVAGGTYAQSSVNSGAASGNNLIHSVGEIYVLPVNPNQASSGTIGAVSRIEFLVLGVDEVIADTGIKIYPNPTTDIIAIETTDIVTSIEVYDTNGRLVTSQKTQNNRADLSSLQNGTYIISTNNKQTFKVIKK